MKRKRQGLTIRISPDVARLDIPMRHVDDLPQLRRHLEALALQLGLLHQATHLSDNEKLWQAYGFVRTLNRKLKKEYPHERNDS
jgi:hypothetical protein